MERFWELDSLRGIAVVMMIAYHVVYDLDYFRVIDVGLSSGFLLWFGRSIPVLFLLLVGIGLTISTQRGRGMRHYMLRGMKIFGFGLLITAVTYVMFPGFAIYFGILHLIGVSIALAYPMLRFRVLNLVCAAVVFSLTPLLSGLEVSGLSLIWLGLKPEGYMSFDYFPIIPWFGFVLIGLYLGFLLYSGKERNFSLRAGCRICRPIAFLGRHSLIIYLLHQPLLYGALYFLV